MIEKLKKELIRALREKNELEVQTIRLILAAIHNKEIQKKAEKNGAALNDEEVLSILRSEEKKRKEAITAFEAGGRADLAKKETKELAIIAPYLPAMMSAQDVKKKVKEIIAKAPKKEFGPVMKMVMAELAGKADSKLVTEAVKTELGS